MGDLEGWDNVQGRRYPPVGKCIYCGSDGGPKGLTDEHMIPFSLGGDAVLPKASCAACATETSKIELYLARHIFHGLRSHVGAPSRKKSLPSILRANISVGDQEDSYEFLAADQPFALILPTWDYPGIMRQVQPSEDFPVCNVRAYNSYPETFGKLWGWPTMRRTQSSRLVRARSTTSCSPAPSRRSPIATSSPGMGWTASGA